MQEYKKSSPNNLKDLHNTTFSDTQKIIATMATTILTKIERPNKEQIALAVQCAVGILEYVSEEVS